MSEFEELKAQQKKTWAGFGAVQQFNAMPAARLVAFAQVKPGQRVLDVACGTGVVAISAARAGARVTGLDLTPELVALAKENAKLVGVAIDFHEGDAEKLPFADGSFDLVLSQFGHMFAPRPEVVSRELARVAVPGGRIAVSTWPEELFTGRFFQILAKYLPPPTDPKPAPPPRWGNVDVVRERFAAAGLIDITFDRDAMRTPHLSPQHFRAAFERDIGPMTRAVKMLENEPERLAALRREIDELCASYWDDGSNVLRQDFLMTRATKPR